MAKPRAITEPTTWAGTETPSEALASIQALTADTQNIVQGTEDRAHHAELAQHGAGVLYGLRVTDNGNLTLTVERGRVALGGSYSENAGTVETLSCPDDATSYWWVRGADYTTEQGTDATTLVFSRTTSTTAPDTTYEWLMLCKAVCAGGVLTLTEHPYGRTYTDNPQARYVRCYNASGVALVRGDPVYVVGVRDDTTNLLSEPRIALADGDLEAKQNVIGLACTDIANNALGYVQTWGLFDSHHDDATWTAGDRLWVDGSGALTATEPASAAPLVGTADGSAGLWVGPIVCPQHTATTTGLPAGSDTEVQINVNGALGADSRFTFDPETGSFSAGDGTTSVGHYLSGIGTVSRCYDSPGSVSGLRNDTTSIIAADILGQFAGWGMVTGWTTVNVGSMIRFVASETWAEGTAAGSRAEVWTVANGGTTAALAAVFGSDKTFAVNGEYVSTREAVSVAVFGATTDVAVGDGAYAFCVPAKLNGYNLVGCVARVITAGATGTTDIQLRRSRDTAGTPRTSTDADMLSTKATIDSGELCTETAATALAINTSNDDVQTGDVIFVDVDAVSSTAPKGLFVALEFAKAVA